jgi:hypothetical protein
MTMEQEGKAVQDPYRAVSLVLLAAAILGMTAAFVGGITRSVWMRSLPKFCRHKNSTSCEPSKPRDTPS